MGDFESKVIGQEDRMFAFWYCVLLVIFMVYYSFWFLVDDGALYKIVEPTMSYGPFSNNPRYKFLEAWFILYYVIYYHGVVIRAFIKEKLLALR